MMPMQSLNSPSISGVNLLASRARPAIRVSHAVFQAISYNISGSICSG
jgi:hypothetical protein